MEAPEAEILEYAGDRALPEDDGMHTKRRMILAIQQMNITNAEKSRLMLALMTDRYASTLPGCQSPAPVAANSSDLLNDREGFANPTLDSLQHSTQDRYSGATSPTSPAEVIRVTSADLEPTYWIPPIPGTGEGTVSPARRDSLDSDVEEEEEEPILGCQHYKRNVKLQCATCERWYTCRFCHDEAEDHKLIRPDTKYMLCMLCGCAQPASEECRDCGESAAWYYCDVCKLWDNDTTKSIYHCDDCGICRRGEGLGRDFFHCRVRIPRVLGD
jgi:uncharacterized CHY-type Zn-finger protein